MDSKTINVERDSDGKLPAYAWPGGYPIIYIDRECKTVCADCATSIMADSETDVEIVATDVYYEGPDMYCEECNKVIESAYGDPNEEEVDSNE